MIIIIALFKDVYNWIMISIKIIVNYRQKLFYYIWYIDSIYFFIFIKMNKNGNNGNNENNKEVEQIESNYSIEFRKTTIGNKGNEFKFKRESHFEGKS